jgi:hypothetical protein
VHEQMHLDLEYQHLVDAQLNLLTAQPPQHVIPPLQQSLPSLPSQMLVLQLSQPLLNGHDGHDGHDGHARMYEGDSTWSDQSSSCSTDESGSDCGSNSGNGNGSGPRTNPHSPGCDIEALTWPIDEPTGRAIPAQSQQHQRRQPKQQQQYAYDPHFPTFPPAGSSIWAPPPQSSLKKRQFPSQFSAPVSHTH